jgi:glyoxylase I family protein
MAGFPGIAHIAITITDHERALAFYTKLFGSPPIADENPGGTFRHTIWVTDNGTLLSLHTHDSGTDPNDRMDETRVGLDHVGFGVENRAQLEEWGKRLDDLGIAHSGIVDASYGSGLAFRDPDNNALEFFAPPA